MEELMHNFNKILDEKREEIIAIAAKKKDNKKMTNADKLDMDTSKTIYRINAATEKKYKDSAQYKKKANEYI
jgi:uncharacterized membrane protein